MVDERFPIAWVAGETHLRGPQNVSYACRRRVADEIRVGREPKPQHPLGQTYQKKDKKVEIHGKKMEVGEEPTTHPGSLGKVSSIKEEGSSSSGRVGAKLQEKKYV